MLLNQNLIPPVEDAAQPKSNVHSAHKANREERRKELNRRLLPPNHSVWENVVLYKEPLSQPLKLF